MKTSWHDLTKIGALLCVATLESCVPTGERHGSSDEIGSSSMPATHETTVQLARVASTQASENAPSERHPAGSAPLVDADGRSDEQIQLDRLYEEHFSLIRKGEIDEAELMMRRIIAIEPNNGKNYSNLGALLSDIGRLPEAEVAYKQAVFLEPDNLIAQTSLGNVLGQLGKFAESEEACKRAVDLIPNHAAELGTDDDLFALVYDNLGNSLYFQGKLPEAEKAFRKAVELTPNNPLRRQNLANTLRDQGKRAEAGEFYQRIR